MKKNDKNFFTIYVLVGILVLIYLLRSSNSFNNLYILFEYFFTFFSSYYFVMPYVELKYSNNTEMEFYKLIGIRLAVVIFFYIVSLRYVVLVFDAVFCAFLSYQVYLLRKNNNDSVVDEKKSDDKPSVVVKGEKIGYVVGDGIEYSKFEQRNYKKPEFGNYSFNYSDNRFIKKFINNELKNLSNGSKFGKVPFTYRKKKVILQLIFSLLLFVYTSLIFFHFPIYTYVIGGIIVFIFFVFNCRYTKFKYFKKILMERPDENIDNILMAEIQNFVPNYTIVLSFSYLAVIALSLFIFYKPHVMYEKMENGYGVRYYTFGLSNYKTASIPESYKGQDVISLRGNAFSNMPYLESVTLPDTITEIRGQAFKNDKKLEYVKLPSNLEYLGGGAFYNCVSLKKIELPDSLTYLGGEAFYRAESLEEVKLSSKLSEIRGYTFYECKSLKSIVIPDSVTRIGSHAFYGCKKLSSVDINVTSKLKSIGSSAFRGCVSLEDIYIPKNVEVESNSFKNSYVNLNKQNKKSSDINLGGN